MAQDVIYSGEGSMFTWEKGEVDCFGVICLIDIKRIISDYYQQLYAKKMDNLEEKDKFFEKHNFPKINQ